MAESIVLIFAIVVIIIVFLSFVPLNLWISALASGVHVSIFTLIGMKIRRVSPAKIVAPLIKAEKAGLAMEISKMEAHYLAGGNLDRVITALITARGANIKLDFPEACAIDLAGRDVLQAVQMSVNPRVIETPVIAAIAKDGIELRARARVTVRANIERLVGGAGEETIVARVGEGIVTTVGSAQTHKEVLENPDLISRTVLDKGLDAGTAFEILSIDIADVDVGRNVGAQLQMDQAEADRRIAQAKAEERRAMAVARVGEGIVTTVGSAETHKAVLENPDLISRTVLNKGLDAGTAFEILSIDIADVDVGRNVGAQLQMDQAEADRRIAQAKAEERRAMAVAREQEMKAAAQEQRAKVIEAEAEVPKAMAAALREGKLGVMDYYQMQNTIADTGMRDAIASMGNGTPAPKK